MYPFSQSVHPAVRTHLDAQTAFMNDMSKSLFQSFQQMCDLNIRLVQTMLEETERGLRKQQETVQRFVDPFARQGDGGNGEDKSQGNRSAQGQSGPIQSGAVQRGDGNPAGSRAGREARNA